MHAKEGVWEDGHRPHHLHLGEEGGPVHGRVARAVKHAVSSVSESANQPTKPTNQTNLLSTVGRLLMHARKESASVGSKSFG